MNDDQPNKENEVTPEGAVEIDEKDLDQASGGLESLSFNYAKMEYAGQKVMPQDLAGGGGPHIAGAGPGAGPHLKPAKKI
jgi:hypothetical protein